MTCDTRSANLRYPTHYRYFHYMPCHIWYFAKFHWTSKPVDHCHFTVGLLSGWLTHWGRVTHIWVGKLTILGSDNGLSLGRRQAIIWTNAGILLIGPLGTNFSEILVAIEAFSFKRMHFQISSAKWHPFCLGLNVLRLIIYLHEEATSTPCDIRSGV